MRNLELELEAMTRLAETYKAKLEALANLPAPMMTLKERSALPNDPESAWRTGVNRMRAEISNVLGGKA